jgi:hypothetical protein
MDFPPGPPIVLVKSARDAPLWFASVSPLPILEVTVAKVRLVSDLPFL